MNDFTPARPFDRVVSVEMFEHMANWRALLDRVRAWLKPDGRLFMHIFTHRTRAVSLRLRPTRKTGSRSISSPAA